MFRVFGSLRQITTLQAALAVSLTVHAILLTLRFVESHALDRLIGDTPLEVILVNARSQEVPEKAQAVAQARLAGGGEAAQGRATSPLPPGAEVRMGDAAEDSNRRIDRMQREQMQLLARLRREAATLSTESQFDEGTPEAMAERERRRQMLKQLAEIERRIQEENARPRKRYVSPATKEAVYALYYDAMRRRIETRGTEEFPEHQGQKLYGELTMNVTIDAEGKVVSADIIEPSGNRMLDQRAIAIVRKSAPFGVFTRAMRREADQLVVTSRFRFTRDAGLATSLMSDKP